MDENLIYKYYAPTEYSLDALINRYFWFSKREFLNDPFDLGNFKKGRVILNVFENLVRNYSKKEEFYELEKIQNLVSEYASCSFTRSELNKQMWAYYAKDYSGWCLAFRRGKLNTRNDSSMSPVIYVDDNFGNVGKDIEDLKYGSDPIENILKKTLCTKHESWSHEEEERIVIKMKSGANGDKRTWGSYELDHIVIGNKINPAYRSIISNISEKFNVDVYEIDLGTNDFELIKK